MGGEREKTRWLREVVRESRRLPEPLYERAKKRVRNRNNGSTDRASAIWTSPIRRAEETIPSGPVAPLCWPMASPPASGTPLQRCPHEHRKVGYDALSTCGVRK